MIKVIELLHHMYHLVRVKGARAAGNALANESCVVVDEYSHGLCPLNGGDGVLCSVRHGVCDKDGQTAFFE